MISDHLKIREEKGGLFIFNNLTGLIYFVSKESSESVIQWLKEPSKHCVSEEFEESLGAGWYRDIRKSNLNNSQVLPDLDKWNSQYPDYPLAINWFLTGSCPLDCSYCYAEDLMRKNVNNPRLTEVIRIVENILDLNPLVVVITGGDPLMSPYLKDAVKSLHDKVGLILDTSGHQLKPDMAKFLRDYNVSIRISLDSDNPEVNNIQRPLMNKKHQRKRDGIKVELQAIKTCLELDLPLTIQTVLTNRNAASIIEFGEFLVKMGIQIWRIQRLQEPSHKILKDDYRMLNLNSEDRSVDNAIRKLKSRSKSEWKERISVKITENNYSNRNSVILVSPDGKFYTESINTSGKFLIDTENPHTPSRKAILKFINHSGHLVRYLNL